MREVTHDHVAKGSHAVVYTTDENWAVTETEQLGYALVTLHFPNGTIVTARGDPMAYTLPDGYQVEVAIAYVDAGGNPATVDGNVTWSSSDPTILTVTADTTVAQQMQAIVAATGALGNAQVQASADADLGSGITTLNTLMDVTVVAGQAVSGTIQPVGAAEPIPPARAGSKSSKK